MIVVEPVMINMSDDQ